MGTTGLVDIAQIVVAAGRGCTLAELLTGMIAPQLREPLRRALTGEAPGETSGETMTWPLLDDGNVAALIGQGMAPLVYAATHDPRLRPEALRLAAEEPLRLDDLRIVLRAIGVRVLILKGTALAYDLYAQPDHRPRSDTDLLIAREDLPAIRKAMARLGFDEQVTSGDDHGLRQLGFSRVDHFGVAHLYDVHWAIANPPLFADVIRFEEVAPLALPKIGADAFGLPRVEALLLACIHRVAHHHDEERLIWLADIALLRRAMSRDEHRRFWQRAFERQVVAVCRRSIELAEIWFGGDPEHAAERFLSAGQLARREPTETMLDRDVTYAQETLANLRALPWRARLTRLRQLAFPPPAFMRHSFANQSRIMLPLLYVYRGARGVVRLFRRSADL